MIELRRILCPIDFSDASAHAVEQAVAVARWSRGRVTALHVLPHRRAGIPGLGGADMDATDDPEALRARMVSFCKAAVCSGIDLDVAIESGHPSDVVLEHALAMPADLIVMGTHGTSGFRHLVLGSVTEKVLRHASCPVLAVPPRAQATSRLPFGHVLCAVDFSDSSLAGVNYAGVLAGEAGAELTLLHVLEWPWEEPPAPDLAGVPAEQAAALGEYRRYCEERARARLDELASRAPARSRSVLVRNGNAPAQILDVAADEHSDLIVIGVRGRNPLDLAVFGSTANQVVRRASCPVLTLRR